MLRHHFTYLLKLLGVAALYAQLLYIGESHFNSDAIVGYFEPASGLALAALLIGGKRYAWSIPLGALLINATSDNSLWEVAIIASGDTLQALCGAWLLTREGKFDLRLQSLRDYLRLILLGGGASIAIGALTVSTVLLASGLLAPGNYFHSLIQWWMSDMLGVMLIAPLILVWLGIRKDWRTAWMMAEAALILGMVILACQVIFLGWWHDAIGQVAKGYWMFLVVTWVAIRIGSCGTTVVLSMTAVYALLGATQGVGFFADDIAQTQLINYWLYMMTLSIVGMALATHFTERKQLEQQLSRRLRHRDVLERITQISLNSASIKELLERVLDEILTVFNADRAYFLYPCDPDAPSWSVPMERTRPEWPGAFARGMVIPMTPEVAEVFRELLASTKPLPYGHAASRCLPAAVALQFSIRSMIQMALRPRVDSPWVIGLHHCTQAHTYNEDELLIFGDIGLRVADALSSMIILKNLRESEVNLSRAQAVGQVGSWLLDIPANRLEWSAETYRIFGIPQQDAVDVEAFIAVTHLDDRDLVLTAWGEAMAGAPYDIEHRIVVGGQERWVRECAQIEHDSEGQPLIGIGTVQDITERKQLETMLRKRTDELALHNQVLQQISLGMPLPKVLDELARQVEALHPGMLCSILLMDEDGKHLRHGAAPSLPDFYNQAIDGLAIGDGIGACGTSAYRGERVIVEDVQQHAYWPEPYRKLACRAGVQSCWSQPFKDSNGRVLGTLAIYHQKPARPSDTEIALIERYADFIALAMDRVRIQDDLRESEERFRQLAENIREVFWMTDPVKNKMLYISPAYEQVWGRTVQSLYDSPRDWLEAIHGEDRQRVLQAALTRQAAGLYDEEYRIVRPNGDIRWIHDQAFPVRDSGGAVYRIVGVAEDITERKQAELALRRYKLVIDTVNDGFWITDAMGNILEANAAYAKISGYALDELVNMHISQLEAIEQSVENVKKHAEKIIARGCERFETCHRHKDGHEIDVEVSATYMSESQQFFVFIHDITERKQTVTALHESEASMCAILNNSPYLSWLKDSAGRYLKVNKVYADYAGLEDIRQVIGKTDFDLWPKELAEKYHADDAEVIATRQQKYVEELSFDGSKQHWVETFKTPIIDENGNVLGTTGFARDITERKQAEEQIHMLAFYDALTQLPNRRLLNDRLGKAMSISKRSGRYGALMFLDLDNFKPLNDTHGHGVGDLLLIEVAQRLTRCVREADTVARFGGDEFVVMLGDLDADKVKSITQAGIVAEKIRRTLAEPYRLKIYQEGKAETTVEHHCAASIGVVIFNSETNAEDVLKWSDMAMYQAKKRGRNQIHFFDSKF